MADWDVDISKLWKLRVPCCKKLSFMSWRESFKITFSLHRIGDLSCANRANNSLSILILYLQVYRTSKIIHVIMQTSWVPIYYYLFCFVFVFLKTWKTDSVVFFKNCGKLMECMKWDALTSLWSIKVMQICIYSFIYRCKTFILHIKLLWVIVKSPGFHILGMWPLMISQMLLLFIREENFKVNKNFPVCS